jgi:hypothetical protein
MTLLSGQTMLLKGILAACVVGAMIWAAGANPQAPPDYLYTGAPKYDPQAWMQGRERFPAGAALMQAGARVRRKIAPGFFASADGVVSYDATRVLFAGKRTASSAWQVWEAPISGGAARAVTTSDYDCIRPLYLPDGRIVYTRMRADGSDVEVAALHGGKPSRLTFSPGWRLTDDVLLDGRILFECASELFTVYPDGTGVESLRCDHGAKRSGGRQIASGDVIFQTGGRLARFTSARAVQMDVEQPPVEAAAPIAEISTGSWLISLRPRPSAAYRLFWWTQATGRLVEVEAGNANAVQPVVVQPRTPPREIPSGLVDTRRTGNLLCLNAQEKQTTKSDGLFHVKVYTRDVAGAPVPLGQAPVERDGSLYIEVPADQPLRLELLDGAGRVVRGEREWFWMRPSEQRICVGCHTGPERAPENKVPEVLLRTTKPEQLLGLKP